MTLGEDSRAKHHQIFEAVHREIRSGRYPTDRRIPSELEYARRFGVSRPTVARALRDLIALGLLERRAGSGTYLRPQTVASSMIFGLIVSGLGNTEILDPICTELTRASEAAGYSMLWGGGGDAGREGGAAGGGQETDYSAQRAEDLCRQYIERRVAGVFFAPLELPEDRDAVNRRIVAALRQAGIPVVLLDRDYIEFPQRSHLDLVGIDNFAAGALLTEHLIQLGAKKIHFLAKPRYPATTLLRLAGCRDTLERHGLELPPAAFHVMDPSTASAAESLLTQDRPEALICSNDLTAALLIRSLTNLGLRLPADMRIVGFDDVRYATLLPVPLTTMRQPCRALGQVAVQMMKERCTGSDLPGRQVLLQAELVVRQSCGGRR